MTKLFKLRYLPLRVNLIIIILTLTVFTNKVLSQSNKATKLDSDIDRMNYLERLDNFEFIKELMEFEIDHYTVLAYTSGLPKETEYDSLPIHAITCSCVKNGDEIQIRSKTDLISYYSIELVLNITDLTYSVNYLGNSLMGEPFSNYKEKGFSSSMSVGFEKSNLRLSRTEELVTGSILSGIFTGNTEKFYLENNGEISER